MAHVVGFTPEDWPIARDAINAVRRGGLEHPFHRRQSPVSSGDELILIKYTDPDALLGPRNSGGIQWEGDCEVYDHAVTGASTPSPIPTGTANGVYCQGLVVPGEYVWARFSNNKYWVQSALHMVRATAISSAEATVTTEYGTVNVTFSGLCSTSDEEIVAGQVVGLSWAWRVIEPDLLATKLCCPPEPA